MENKKKVLIAGVTQFGYFTDHYILSKFLKKHFEVDYICIDQNKYKLEEPNINVIYVKNNGRIKRQIKFILTVIRIANSGNYSTIILINDQMAYLIGMFISGPTKILDIRTGDLSSYKLIRQYKNFLIYFTSIFFDKTLIISESLKKLLKINGPNIFIVPLGADVVDEMPKKYDRIHLLYIGTIDKRNIEKTIEGLALFRLKHKKDISIHYDIVGQGKPNSISVLLSSIELNNLQGIVEFHGRKERFGTELPLFFRNATIGVCFVPQTAYYDTQPPTKLFEYAFSGLINIATSTFENCRYITRDNGVLCQDSAQSFSEALEVVYQSLASYNEQKIRTSLSDYSWEKIANELLVPILNKN